MSNDSSGQTHIFTSFPETHQDQLVEENLDTEEKTSFLDENILPQTNYSIWQLEYYQKYFNINTSDFIARIIGSMVPSFGQNSLLNKIRHNPDLYGPFWIAITLICTIAIGGNIVSFVHNFGENYTWQTDFHKITSSAFTIVSYSVIIPAILYVLMRSRQARTEMEFIEILCIYGYSMAIYVPVSLLWLINISIMQWILVIVSIILSGSVLFLTFWPAISQDQNRNVALGIMSAILILNALLGLGFMLFFFHYPSADINASITTSLPKTASNNTKL